MYGSTVLINSKLIGIGSAPHPNVLSHIMDRFSQLFGNIVEGDDIVHALVKTRDYV